MSDSAAIAPWSREYEGPRCPCCYRNDGTHNEGCPLPAYLAAWKKIHKEAVDEYVEAVFPRHSSLCSMSATGHHGPCTCGADPRG